MKRFVIFIALGLMMASCGNKKTKPMTADELYNECATGIVMVISQSYAELTLADKSNLYWSDNYGHIGFTDNVNLISTYRDVKAATGFFVSEKGKIFTDFGIVMPDIDRDILEQRFDIFKQGEMEECDESRIGVMEELAKVDYRIKNAEFWSQTPAQKDVDERSRLQQLLSAIETKRQQWADMSINDVKVRIVNELRIAYNNTTITNMNDLEECEILPSDDGAVFAAIQLESRTPLPNTHIFKTNSAVVEAGQTVYKIYFDGTYDVLTPVKAKLLIGKAVSDAYGSIWYDFPDVNAVGAPVLDEYGNLAMAMVSQEYNWCSE